jgi:hypothetical protein
MVRLVQPGGESGIMRVHYSSRRKYALLDTTWRLRRGGMSLNHAAAEIRVSTKNLSRWERAGIGNMDPKDKLFKSKKMSTHPGPSGQLSAIDEPLLRYVFEQRKQGYIVDTLKILLHASYLYPEFREKSFAAQASAVKCWLMAHSMRYQMGSRHTLRRCRTTSYPF